MIEERYKTIRRNGCSLLNIQRFVSDRETLKPANFGTISSYFTLDSVTKIAYGKEFGWMAANEDLYHWNEMQTSLVPMTVLGAAIPAVGVLLNILRRVAGPSPKDAKGLGRALRLVPCLHRLYLDLTGLAWHKAS